MSDGRGQRRRYDGYPGLHTIANDSQKVLSKIEWRIAAWAAIAFFALDLDRSNISQANADNFLEDLGLTTNGMCRATSPLYSIFSLAV